MPQRAGCLVVSAVVPQQLSVAVPLLFLCRKTRQPWVASEHRVGTLCTEPFNTSHLEQQHDNELEGVSSIDAGTVLSRRL